MPKKEPIMNVIICCGGRLQKEHELAKFTTQKANLLLVTGETIIQRAVRILKGEGITDILVPYTGMKPKVKGVTFRKVIPKYLLQATVYQCRDKINNTLLIEGDVVFERRSLKEILAIKFDEFLYIKSYMFLVKPKGNIKLQQLYKKDAKRYQIGGWAAGHRFEDLSRALEKEFSCKVVEHKCKTTFIGDIDDLWELNWVNGLLKKEVIEK